MARKLLLSLGCPPTETVASFISWKIGMRYQSQRKTKVRLHHFCVAAIPFLALTIGPPFANRLEPRIFGLPFLLAYLVFWVLATPPFMLIASLIRRPR